MMTIKKIALVVFGVVSLGSSFFSQSVDFGLNKQEQVNAVLDGQIEKIQESIGANLRSVFIMGCCAYLVDLFPEYSSLSERTWKQNAGTAFFSLLVFGRLASLWHNACSLYSCVQLRETINNRFNENASAEAYLQELLSAQAEATS